MWQGVALRFGIYGKFEFINSIFQVADVVIFMCVRDKCAGVGPSKFHPAMERNMAMTFPQMVRFTKMQ